MIPFLQLDPITLTLWSNQTLLAECADDSGLGHLVSLAYDHRYDDIKDLISLLANQATKDTAIRICSEVWHEKRHFLDLVLTNYGSFRWRQGYQTYNNFQAIFNLRAEIGGDKFAVPLSVYSSRLACRELGVQAHPMLERLGVSQRRIADLLQIDSQEIGNGVRVGGEAQLEALAYYYQLEAAADVFGPTETLAALKRLEYSKRAEKTHNWALDLLGRAGLYGEFPDAEQPDCAEKPEYVVEPSPFICLMYGALNGRYHGIDDDWKTLPAYRLGALIEHFKVQKTKLADIESFDLAWSSVNSACKKVFGRTVLEEIEADIDAFELKRKQSGMKHEAMADEYVELRKNLFEVLCCSPEEVLFPTEYKMRLAPRLCPFLASATPDGLDGRPGDDFHAVLDIDFKEHFPTAVHDLMEKDALRYSTFASISRTWPPQLAPNPLGMKSVQNWLPMIEVGASIVRVLESGMRWPTMCGFEILQAKAIVERALGKRLVVERQSGPYFETVHSVDYGELVGSSTSVCDFTEKRYSLSDCEVISPWAFHESDAHREALMRHMSRVGEWMGLPPHVGNFWAARIIAKSWSPWVVHKDFGWDDDPGIFEKRLSLAASVDDRNPNRNRKPEAKAARKGPLSRLFSWLR